MRFSRLRALILVPVALAVALPSPAVAKPKKGPSKICALTNAADGVSPSPPTRIKVAKAYGLTCVRDGISTLRWTGSSDRTEAFLDAGFKLVLNVRNQPGGVQAPPSTPPVTDAEFETFERNVRQIVKAYHPALLTVENEEEAPKFFDGTMSQYLKELRSAIDVAHRHDVKVTNGGITGLPMALITWQRLRTNNSEAAADDFARRTFGQPNARPGWAGILNDLLAKPYAGLESASAREAWDRAKFLVDAYKKPEGKRKKDRTPLDFVNFHWYFEDPQALHQAVRVLEHKTNRKVATTEIGQYDRDPQTVLDVLGASVAEELRWIVWYDGDGDPAQALHNSDCTLRPNGEAFRDFVVAHPPANTPVPCAPGRR